ncbi:MAG TPA: polysaccharide deacetylase family protein [Bacteroidota bacterium]|nr:polysaccharide deacetylase family protein [Bacteroidota bacterium]
MGGPLVSTPTVVNHGVRDGSELALTFDACSTPEHGKCDEAVVRILEETRTPATIFLGGKWVNDQVWDTRILASNPYIEFGNHTYSHPHLTGLTDDQVRSELLRAQKVIARVVGTSPTLFRPPYGEYNERVVRIASQLGLTTVEYDLASGDPDPKITRDALVRYVVSRARPGSIIVMHINGRGWHTAEALPEIIARLRDKGYTFVTVSELIRQKKIASVFTSHALKMMPSRSAVPPGIFRRAAKGRKPPTGYAIVFRTSLFLQKRSPTASAPIASA